MAFLLLLLVIYFSLPRVDAVLELFFGHIVSKSNKRLGVCLHQAADQFLFLESVLEQQLDDSLQVLLQERQEGERQFALDG